MKLFATKKVFVCALFLFLSSNTIAQNYYFQANSYFEKKDYDNAIPLYIKLIKTELSSENLEKLAKSYYYINDYFNAETYFRELINRFKTNNNNVYLYANVLQKNEQFEAAIQQYESILKSTAKINNNITLQIAKCKFAIQCKAQCDTTLSVLNVKNLNSKFDESGIFIGSNYIYVSSSRKISNILDERNNKNKKINNYAIYKSKYSNLIDINTYKSITEFILPSTNNYEDLAHPSLNSEENSCYYSSSYSYTAGDEKFENHNESTYTEIYIKQASKIKNKWCNPLPLINPETLNYQLFHPCLSKDGKRLYFASNMSGGYGSYDIYYIEKDRNDNWSKPINLGNKVNTANDELYPSYANDTVLYFSSNGHLGMGELDIYKATISTQDVKEIIHLKYPINSSRNDHSYVPISTSRAGLFCSDRPGGLGNKDIYLAKSK